MIRLTVPQLLERQREVIKSIDLRVIAVREGEVWRNGITVIRFSAHETRRLAADQEQLKARLTGNPTDDMQVIVEAFDISHLNTLRQQLQARSLDIGAGRIEFAKENDILEGSGYFPDRYPISKRSGGWPVLECRFASGSYPLNTETAAMAVEELGFPDARTLAREVVEFDTSRDGRLDLLVQLPFWATIRSWDLQKDVLTVSVEAHRKLVDLTLRVFITVGRSGSMAFNESVKLSESKWNAVEGEFLRTEKEFPIGDTVDRMEEAPRLFEDEPRGNLKLVLAHASQPPMNVYEKDKPLEWHGRAGPVDLLCRVLALFCPEGSLMDRLLEPGKVKMKPRIQPQHVFEKGICWLLTTCGFQTILLEEYEMLRDRETRVELGTLDALAWLRQENVLLLVACTLGLPKPNEIDTLNEVKLILRREVPDLGETDVRPVVFCRREEVSSSRADAAKVGVAVLGVADLDMLWELAKRGDQDGVLSILSLPESS